MMIPDDADEHTGDALEQDPDSDSEAIILLSHRMSKAGEIKEDLNMAFDDELARHSCARFACYHRPIHDASLSDCCGISSNQKENIYISWNI